MVTVYRATTKVSSKIRQIRRWRVEPISQILASLKRSRKVTYGNGAEE